MADRICDNCMSRVPEGAEKCPECGILFTNTNPGGALPNGWVLAGRYTVGRYIDIDGEGVLYSAIDADTMLRVTIKEFMPVTLCASRNEDGSIRAKPGCEVLFKTTRLDFTDLFANIMELGLVEGLVQVMDVFEENNTGYAVLEKIEGPTLAEYLTKREGPVDAARALALMRPVMAGVETMHNANLIHRGIGPENIVLESGGTAKLCGFATLALRQQGSELKPKLYPGYSAPEQYAASEFEGRYTDIYALGAVLYRLLTGYDPIAADERKLQDSLRNARAVNKGVPGFLSSGVARAMRVLPAERIQSVEELKMVLSGEGSRDVKGPLGLTKQQMLVGIIAAASIVVLLLIVLLISAFTRNSKDDSSSMSLPSSVSVGETIPNFVNMRAADVLKHPSYTSVFKFAEPTEEESDTVAAGFIISQTPEAGTIWDGETPIKFVVSKGVAEVEMPELTSPRLTRQQAMAKMTEAGITNYEFKTEANKGEYDKDMVIRTEPKAGALVKPSDKVIIYVAGEVDLITMTDVVNLSQGDAETEMKRLEVKYRIVLVPNDKGRGSNGRVASTDPAAGGEIAVAATTVNLNIYENYKMPDLNSMGFAGKSLDEVKNTLNNLGIPYTEARVDTNDANLNGKVQGVSNFSVGVEVNDGTVATITVYNFVAPPPASPTDG